MPTEEPPPDNVIPFRPRKGTPTKPSAPSLQSALPPAYEGSLIPTPDFLFYPITLEEILDALRECLMHITDGGVGRGLPKNSIGLEQVFMAMFLAWTRGHHCTDPATGIVTIVLTPDVVAQVEHAFRVAGFVINKQIITDGLRVKPSYLNVLPIKIEREPEPEPEPPQSA